MSKDSSPLFVIIYQIIEDTWGNFLYSYTTERFINILTAKGIRVKRYGYYLHIVHGLWLCIANIHAMSLQLEKTPFTELPLIICTAQQQHDQKTYDHAIKQFCQQALSRWGLQEFCRDKQLLSIYQFDKKTEQKIFTHTQHVHELHDLYTDRINYNIHHGHGIVSTFIPSKKKVKLCACHAQLPQCALITQDNTIIITTIPKRTILQKYTVADPITTISWAPHDTVLAIGTKRGDIFMYSCADKKIIQHITTEATPIQQISWRIDQRFVFATNQNNTIFCIDTRTWKKESTFDHITATHIHWNSFDKEYALATDRTVHIYSPERDQRKRSFATDNIIHTIAWSPDGHEFLIGSANTITIVSQPTWTQANIATNVSAPLTCACWAPNSKYIFTGAADGTICTLDAEKHILCATYKHHDQAVKQLNWNNHGNYLLVTYQDGTTQLIRFIDRAYYQQIKHLSLAQIQLIVAIKQRIIKPLKRVGSVHTNAPFKLPGHLQELYTTIPRNIRQMLEEKPRTSLHKNV